MIRPFGEESSSSKYWCMSNCPVRVVLPSLVKTNNIKFVLEDVPQTIESGEIGSYFDDCCFESGNAPEKLARCWTMLEHEHLRRLELGQFFHSESLQQQTAASGVFTRTDGST